MADDYFNNPHFIRDALKSIDERFEKLDGKMDHRFEKLGESLEEKFNYYSEHIRNLEDAKLAKDVRTATIASICGLIPNIVLLLIRTFFTGGK